MIDQGGNQGTTTKNNAANKISGHRSGAYSDYPVPGNYENNWNGYETGIDIKSLLMDPENYDFRPLPNSLLVNAGINIEGITDDYVGEAPDIGAYEHGGEFWRAGISWDLSTTFGDNFHPPNLLYSVEKNPMSFDYKLKQNYPNPFNLNTTLSYHVARSGMINISIYDLMGRNIKTLVNGFQKSGLTSVVWDATNDEGHEVAAGLYFYKMEAGNFRRTNKMLLLK